MKRFVGPLLILLCTLIWGTAFVAQKTGSEHYGPFALTCFRNLLASVFLAGVIWTRNRIQHRTFRADGAVALGGALNATGNKATAGSVISGSTINVGADATLANNESTTGVLTATGAVALNGALTA